MARDASIAEWRSLLRQYHVRRDTLALLRRAG
jgi:hypothetical protein